MTAALLNARARLPSMPLRDAARVVYLDRPGREVERYYERCAHGGVWFDCDIGPDMELVPTPVGARMAAHGVQYVRTRGRWSNEATDWEVCK